MRIPGWQIVCLAFVGVTVGPIVAQSTGAGLTHSTLGQSEPSILDKVLFAALVSFGSGVSYAFFGMPKARRFERIFGELTAGQSKLSRRALELAVVAITGGITGYFMLMPTNGAAAISAGALWYGAFYRIAHNNSGKR
jgi:hypothetical protein